MPTNIVPAHTTAWLVRTESVNGSDVTHYLHLGFVNKIAMTFNKSTSVVPIVTKSASSAFPLDGGTSKSYTFNGYRIQPKTIADSGGTSSIDASMSAKADRQSGWSCKKWATELKKFIDRWQMKTDGCEIWIQTTDNPYTGIGQDSPVGGLSKIYGYIRSIEYTYNSDYPEMLSYYMTFEIGTCRMRGQKTDAPPYAEYLQSISISEGMGNYVAISDTEKSRLWIIGGYAVKASVVESYAIKGGPLEPFEHIELSIPTNALKETAKDLFDYVRGMQTSTIRGVLGSRNEVSVHAVGQGTYTVSSVSGMTVSNNSRSVAKIKAYCPAWSFKNAYLRTEVRGSPLEILLNILESGDYGPVFTNNALIKHINPLYESDGYTTNDANMLIFDKDVNVWYVLQVCSIMLNSKLFFSCDKAYLIDYTLDLNLSGDPQCHRYVPDVENGKTVAIDVYPPRPANRNTSADFMFSRVLKSSYGSQGADSIVTKVSITCNDGNGNFYSDSYSDEDAQSWLRSNSGRFSEKTVSFNIPELVQGGGRHQAEDFATNYLKYMSEPQQSISMTVKENEGDRWRALFLTVAQADSIWDSTKDLTPVNNYSIYDGSTQLYQKLYLSTYTRNYPDMTTEYEWGVINDVDLPNRLATDF